MVAPLPDRLPYSPDLPLLFYVPETVDHPDHRDRAQAIRDATSQVWDDWNVGKARTHVALGNLLRQHNRDGTVVLMVVNAGHLRLFENWAASCERHNIDVRSWCVVFTLDEEAADRVDSLGFAQHFDEHATRSMPVEAAETFGDERFVRLMFPKTVAVRDVLDMGYDVLFQDVDLVWRRDPLPLLNEPSRRRREVQFMYDGPNAIYAPLHANTGFFLLRNTPLTRDFWDEVCGNLEMVMWYRSQQAVVNRVLVAHYFRGLDVDILHEKEFANGHLFSIEDTTRLPADPAVVHCSWTRNLEHKLEKLRLVDLWYLD